jgi:hypothetical protein
MKVTTPLLGLLIALSTSAAFAAPSLTAPLPNHPAITVNHAAATVAKPKPVVAHVATAPAHTAPSVTHSMPTAHAVATTPAPRRQQASLFPSRSAPASGGRIVATTTSTGKAVSYDCSKAGNRTKTACKR